MLLHIFFIIIDLSDTLNRIKQMILDYTILLIIFLIIVIYFLRFHRLKALGL